MFNNRGDIVFYPFLKSREVPVSEAATSESYWNNGYGIMTLEVTGTFSNIEIEVQGCVNILGRNGETLPDSEIEWTTLGLWSGTDGTPVSKVENKGIFRVEVAGLTRVRLKVNSIAGGSAVLIGAFSL